MPALSITATAVVSALNTNVSTRPAGAAITAGQVVYFDPAAGTFLLADADSANALARVPTGIALNGGAVGQPVTVARGGDITMNAVMTAGVGYYLGDVAGTIVPVGDLGTGDFPVFLGFAKSTTVLALDITASSVALG